MIEIAVHANAGSDIIATSVRMHAEDIDKQIHIHDMIFWHGTCKIQTVTKSLQR
jgi:hypothetical protein